MVLRICVCVCDRLYNADVSHFSSWLKLMRPQWESSIGYKDVISRYASD